LQILNKLRNKRLHLTRSVSHGGNKRFLC